jgi:hypothetical protein
MNTQKLLIGTVVGAVYFWLIDWVLYTMVLSGLWSMPEGYMKESPDMLWMIIGYLIFAGAFTWIYNKGVGGDSRVMEAIRYAVALGVLFGFGWNLVWYSMSTGNPLSTYLIDGVVTIVKFGIGAIIIAYAAGIPALSGGGLRGSGGGEGGGGGGV